MGSGEEVQPIRALFDTGSANAWILGKGAENYKGQNSFDIEKTLTVEEGGFFDEPPEENRPITTITFGSGQLSGYFVTDTLTLGDPDDLYNQMQVEEWTFGLVTEQSTFNSQFDAIIGLAYPEFAEEGVTPIMDALIGAEVLAENLFSFDMSMNPDEESKLTFGAIDHDAYEGEITWHDVKHFLFWSIQLDDVLVDGISTGYCTQEGANCLVTPDSGTSALTFPPGAYAEFVQDYGDSISCTADDVLNFGSLTYVIEGVHYNLPSHHWVRRTQDSSDDFGGKCQSNISELDVNQPGLENMYIAGDLFMQLYYTVFDRDNDQIGFGYAKHSEPEVLMEYGEGGALASVKTLSDYDY